MDFYPLTLVKVGKFLALLFIAVMITVSPSQVLSKGEVYDDILRQWLQTPPQALTDDKLNWSHLQTFYQQRKFKPVWIDRFGFLAHTWTLLEALHSAPEHGLSPKDYHYARIKQLQTTATEKAWLLAELLLTDAFFRYGLHLLNGRLNPQKVAPDWHIPQPDLNPTVLLSTALNLSLQETLEQLAPSHEIYQRLKQALRHYQQFADKGEWPQLPPIPLLKLGLCHEAIPILRTRLKHENILKDNEVKDPACYDDRLAQAVQLFQKLHGLKVDGIVGIDTRKALNIPLQERIRQIQLNMERWRWLPDDLGERYLLINLASFRLAGIKNNKTVLSMRVIIGRAYRATPSFNSEMTSMVLNPSWTVPDKIAKQDLLPLQQKNPNYFQEQKIRVFSGWGEKAKEIDPKAIDWDSINNDHFPYWLQQKPGPHNALGRIKFMFPNPFAVYLHDTPARELFNHRVRTFSSGCIRVEKPLDLADFVLGEGSQIPHIVTGIQSGETQKIALPVPAPIYVIYLTAWAEANSLVHFREDVYNRDQTIIQHIVTVN